MGSSLPFQSSHEDILIREILQTHKPEGDHRVEFAPLLHLAEEIIHYITAPKGYMAHIKAIWADREIRVVNIQSDLGHIIHHISHEILRDTSRDRSSHARTMAVLELLENFSWGTKVIIVLVALAKVYGDFWLISQLSPNNPLAYSIRMLKGLGNGSGITKSFGYRFQKALRYLFERMVDVLKCIVEFEILPMQCASIDCEAMTAVKIHIHLVSYWVIRSSAACASNITSMIAMNSEQACWLISAVWELWSLASKISDMHHHLKKLLEEVYLQIEKKIQSSLLHLFEEVHVDNQKVLSTLFALKNDRPLRGGFSQQKVGVSVLKNKEIILFISRPDILLEKLLLVLQKLQYQQSNKTEMLYEVLWVPIVSSIPWSNAEERAFNYLIDILPWYTLHDPSNLSLSVKKFIQEVWNFQGEPQMVVLDSKGKVTSLNAIDMVSIWGTMAYPFSISRERELWEEQSQTIHILLDGIDPLISHWLEVGRTICLYGSNSLEWIRQLTIKMKDIVKAGISLELIYVGSNHVEDTKDIVATIIEEELSSYLSHIKICFFWLRLESIRNSKLRLGYTIESDFIMKEVTSLLSIDLRNEGWLLVSEGSSTEIFKLSGEKVLECLSLFHIWGNKVNKLGFLGSIRTSFDPPSEVDHCDYSIVIPYTEGMDERIVLCKNCKRPMEKYFMYQCVTS